MKLERVDGSDAAAVLRGLRGAILGSGPAIALAPPVTLAPSDAGHSWGLSPHDAGGARGPTARAASAPPVAAAPPRPLPADVPAGTAVILQTSGSTGHPKRVVLSRDALRASARATADRVGEGAWLLALPAHYIAGVQVLLRSLLAGREPTILGGPFTASAFAAAAAAMTGNARGTRTPRYTALVPAQLRTLLDAADGGIPTGLTDFEAVLVGGQALPGPLADRAAAAGIRIVRTYGSTETSGGCVYDGAPLPGVDVRVESGEVLLAGTPLADGYLGDPELTDAVFVERDGVRWYRTGDAGAFADGIVHIAGRIDNVIVSGGINVSLDRVERVVRTLPGLDDALVVPVPDDRWGQASIVLARADAGEPDALLARIRDAVRAQIGAPARPREVRVLARIPQLSTGKPDRASARARAGL